MSNMNMILYLFLSIISISSADELSDFTVVYPYRDFSSASPDQHFVPENTRSATWSFQAENSYPHSCSSPNVTIVLQHGSLPLITPLGEKQPKNAFLDQRWNIGATFIVPTNNISLVSKLISPKPGMWYSVAYLPEGDGKILPADLFVKCVYRIRNWFHLETGHDIEEVSPNKIYHISLQNLAKKILRFLVPLQTYRFQVLLQDCYHGNQTGCPITMETRGHALPGPSNSTVKAQCDPDNTSCVVTMETPSAGAWHYLQLQSHSDNTNNLSLQIILQDCVAMTSYQSGPQLGQCGLIPMLDKFTFNPKFHNKFGYINGSRFEDVLLQMMEGFTQVVPFRIVDAVDNGGSLIVNVQMQDIVAVENNDLQVKLNVCFQKEAIPFGGNQSLCTDGYRGILNSSQGHMKVIVPYPQSGYWFISVQMQCYRLDQNSTVDVQPCGQLSAAVDVSIVTDACSEGGCSKHGRCINYLNGHVLYTTCKCDDGWRGFDCTDGTAVEADGHQLQELLLLTLSNLIFIPAIVLAAYRRYYVEALVYAYNMVFSGLYHACDGGRREDFTYCAMPINIVSHADFLASATSIWITLVAMARPPLQWKGFLQMCGPLGLLIGVMYRRTSAFLFLVPAGVGLTLILVSWICRCCYRHKCYPSMKKYLMFLVPGLLLAAGGLCIFSFVERETNYMYTHSAWHACMALSVLLLLPPRDSRGHVKVQDITLVDATLFAREMSYCVGI
ncbi:post-GPI attachment to proteins factor 6-like isoform X2 [Dreissena polymorpha]|uniref:post-GPI attachment to proteins factor 6-like isoform X2 n=1 Tax=Dreissena polymorpha TaxID=45954 RepID=UPI0022653ED6|nr:post-GPI attachment to proteins factor 6-like isoform X2 [Dreissena polymorpha]